MSDTKEKLIIYFTDGTKETFLFDERILPYDISQKVIEFKSSNETIIGVSMKNFKYYKITKEQGE